jgi:branched-subunit amino acid transport protein AzlD
MSSSPAMRLERHLDSMGTSPLLAAAATLTFVIAAVDLLTYHVNFPIIYIAPLLLIAEVGRRAILQGAAVAVVLTYAGYFFGSHPPGVDEWPDLGVRFVNRTLAAAAIIASAGILLLGISMRERAQRLHRWPHDPDGRSFQQVVLSLERILAPAMAGILVVALFLGDAFARAQYNVALLYCLPLVILARTRSRRLMWAALPLLIMVCLVGLAISPESVGVSPSVLLTNRLLVCLAMVATAAIIHLRLRHTECP